jgi:competence protein ComEA
VSLFPPSSAPSVSEPRAVAPPPYDATDPIPAAPELLGSGGPRPDRALIWLTRWQRWRADGRVGWAALVLAALVAGVVWYQLGVAASPAAGASRTATTLASTGSHSAGANAAGSTISTAAHTTTSTAATRVVVHVAGAVARPGVVQLPAGSRVIDALEAVGGATTEGDVNRLNLAAKVTDGERIAVPKFGEPLEPIVGGTGTTAGDGSSDPGTSGGATGAPTAGNPLNLNTATEAQVETLPGIGPSLAAAIIAERTKRGGFQAVSDLRSVHGIGDRRFADLQPLVTV